MTIGVRDLSVDIGRRRIVSDVSFEVPTGTFVGLLGPNGSGKSTILKTIYRVNRPSGGTVLVEGRVRAQPRPAGGCQTHRRREPGDVGGVRSPGRGDGDARPIRAQGGDSSETPTTTRCVTRWKPSAAATSSVAASTPLPGGEKQLVLVARALAQQACHIVLDEPTNHLDIRHQSHVLDIVAGQGVTVLAALHDLGLAALYCDRVHLLADGRLHSSDVPADVITAENISAAYKADVLVIAHPETGVPQLLPPRKPSAEKKGHLMQFDPSGASRLRKLLLLATAAALAVFATAYGSSNSAEDGNDTASFPVTVSTCGHSATFQEPPERAVATDVNMVEAMLALDLGHVLVGTFAVGDNTHKIGEPYRDAWNRIKHVSDDYPRLEPLVGLKPDFVFTGWAWGLDESKNITPDNLASHGIKTYILDESCDWAPGGTTRSSISMETAYTDLRNLGKIFGVRSKAEQVVDDMKAKIADVQERVGGTTPKKVFLYDSGDAAPFTAGGLSVPHVLITLAGGTNIFGNVKRSWDGSTWEKVVDAQPDCILLNEYGGSNASTTSAFKEKFLKTSPITKELPAVKNNCILALDFGQITPGPRNAETVEAIARWLHPEAFA